MRSRFLDAAAVQDDNPVGVLNRREAVRDNDGGSAFQQFSKGILNQQLRFRIDT